MFPRHCRAQSRSCTAKAMQDLEAGEWSEKDGVSYSRAELVKEGRLTLTEGVYAMADTNSLYTK